MRPPYKTTIKQKEKGLFINTTNHAKNTTNSTTNRRESQRVSRIAIKI